MSLRFNDTLLKFIETIAHTKRTRTTTSKGKCFKNQKAGFWIHGLKGWIKTNEGNYEYGKRTGLWTQWSRDGYKDEERYYEHGEQTGPYKKWWNLGGIQTGLGTNKLEEGYYKNGEKTGLWTYWNFDGSKSKEGKYEDGEKKDFGLIGIMERKNLKDILIMELKQEFGLNGIIYLSNVL